MFLLQQICQIYFIGIDLKIQKAYMEQSQASKN